MRIHYNDGAWSQQSYNPQYPKPSLQKLPSTKITKNTVQVFHFLCITKNPKKLYKSRARSQKKNTCNSKKRTLHI